MAASVVHCGEIGAGSTTKLANQIIVALNIAAVSGAFMLSVKAGVAPEKVFDAIKGGLAGSTVMNGYIKNKRRSCWKRRSECQKTFPLAAGVRGCPPNVKIRRHARRILSLARAIGRETGGLTGGMGYPR